MQTTVSTWSLSSRLRPSSQSPLRHSIRLFTRNSVAVAGTTVIVLLALSALLAPVLSPYDPEMTMPDKAFGEPSLAHWLGTDYLGRDMLSIILWGGRISLTVGFISVAVGAIVGVLLGLSAGFYAGVLDSAVMRAMDLMLAFPGILLALVIVSVLQPGLSNVMIAVGISLIPTYARTIRSSVLSIRESAYVEAARVVGCSNPRIMLVHILPNAVGPIIVLSTLNLGRAIIAAASLSFLGLGASPPTPEWGAMASSGRNYLRDAWWITTMPGLAIMISVMAINMLGDGLTAALNPRGRR